MKVLRPLLILVCLGCTQWLMPVQAQTQGALQVIELRYRSASELMPILQPLLEPQAALTGVDYKLFVRASAGNVEQLRKAVAELDRMPRQLLVSVRTSGQQQRSDQQVSAGAVIRNSGVSGSIRGGQSTASTQDGGVSSVLVIEGGSAFIASGASVPIVTTVIGGGRRSRSAVGIEQRDLSSGFTVTPRVNGEQVILDIAQQQEQLDNGSIATQSLRTQISGALGSWLQLGGLEQSASSHGSGTLSHRYSTRSDARSIWVKVELQ